MICMKAVFHDIGENAINIIISTHLKCPKIVFGRGSARDHAGGAHDAPQTHTRRGLPSPTTPMASRLGTSIFGAAAKGPLFVESKKSLNYTMQHCCQPFGPCVQTDINVTGLVNWRVSSINMYKGPQSFCDATGVDNQTQNSHKKTQAENTPCDPGWEKYAKPNKLTHL